MSKQMLLLNGWRVPKLVKYSCGYNKLYKDGSGRDLKGVNHAKLIGIYPKLEVQVGSFTQAEMGRFLHEVNSNPNDIKVSWYDEQLAYENKNNGIRSNISYYINDFTIDIKKTSTMDYKSFSFNLIPNKKR